MASPPHTPQAPAHPASGWSISSSSQGDRTTWWATRDRLLTESEISEGLVHTLSADTEPQLRAQIDTQTTTERVTTELASLRAEFPGWEISIHHTPPLYRAVRDSGVGERLGGGTYSALRRLLYDQDTADLERGLQALAEALKARGAPTMRQNFSVVTRTNAGIDRVISAHRRRFIGPNREDLGALSDVDAVADRVMELLDVKR